eukprot:1096189-Prymnesium_polylepis.3
MLGSVLSDAYDDASQAEYASVREGSATDTLYMDARTACLTEMLQSVDQGCDRSQPSLVNASLNEVPTCGLIIQEYADSLWRARYAGPTNAANSFGEACNAASASGYQSAMTAATGTAYLSEHT